MPTLTHFAQQLSESTEAMTSRLDTYLQGLGAIGMQDIVLTRRLDIGTIRWEFTFAFQSPGPLTFRAAYFSSLAGSSVDSQADAFFAGLPAARIHRILDASQERRRALDRDAIICIYADSIAPNCGWDRSRPVVVEAQANIGVGASGQARIVTASGLADTITVLNRSGALWPLGARGYAAMRVGTCIWDGYPTCC